MLVGNKSDLSENRTVKKEEAIEWAENHKMGYIETSANISENVDIAFINLV